MATRLYLRASADAIGGNVPTDPTTQDYTATGAGLLAMLTAAGSSQTSRAGASSGTTAGQSGYFGRWISNPLAAQTINSGGTVTLNAADSESNTSANFWANGSLRLWRPSTNSFVTTVASFGGLGSEPSSASAEQVTIAVGSIGSNVTVQLGDRLVYEAMISTTQAMNGSYTNTIYFDGPTVTTSENASVSNHASFVELSQTVTFDSSVNVNVSGSSATVSKTGVTVPQDASASPSGSSATVSAGTASATQLITASPSGSSATTANSTVSVTQQINASPSGSAATVSAGTVTVDAGGNADANVSGSSATASGGSVSTSTSVSASVSGSAATTANSSVTATQTITASPSGSAATTASSSVSVTQLIAVSVSGSSATASGGTASTTFTANVSVSGSAATTGNSSVTTTAVIPAAVTGSSGTVSASSVTVTLSPSVSVSGSSATASPGTATVFVPTIVNVSGSSATISAGTASAVLVTDAEVDVVGSQATVYALNGIPFDSVAGPEDSATAYADQFYAAGQVFSGVDLEMRLARFRLRATAPIAGNLQVEAYLVDGGSNHRGMGFPISSATVPGSRLSSAWTDVDFLFAEGSATLSSNLRYVICVRCFGGDAPNLEIARDSDGAHTGVACHTEDNGFSWHLDTTGPLVFSLFGNRPTVDVPQEVGDVLVSGVQSYAFGALDTFFALIDEVALNFYGAHLGETFLKPNGETQAPGAQAAISITGVEATPEELISVAGSSATASATGATPTFTVSQDVTPAGSAATVSTTDPTVLAGFHDITGSSASVSVGTVTVQPGTGALPSGSQATVSITGCTIEATDGFLTSSMATISAGTVSVTLVGTDAFPEGVMLLASVGRSNTRGLPIIATSIGPDVATDGGQAVASVGSVAVDIGPYVAPSGVGLVISVNDVVVSLPIDVFVEGSELTITAGGEATRVLDDDVDFSFGTRSVRVPAETYSVLVPVEPHSVTVPADLEFVTVPADEDEVTL